MWMSERQIGVRFLSASFIMTWWVTRGIQVL